MFAKVKPAMSIDYRIMDPIVVVTPYDVNTLEDEGTRKKYWELQNAH